ncbi:hypothetical protein NW762_012900 [Fusarium torreyae]|uniref:Uncharacterized protein n=1 Tax=Fusarium torreyae TaxID=1237075 RepID=A0A9W8RPE0_9HYPO|nr:hypothetical protein NW762_012900 [Fusarium torreyae]
MSETTKLAAVNGESSKRSRDSDDQLPRAKQQEPAPFGTDSQRPPEAFYLLGKDQLRAEPEEDTAHSGQEHEQKSGEEGDENEREPGLWSADALAAPEAASHF